MKVAVTGASGFLGKVLVRDLAEQGHSVICLSRRPAPADEPHSQSVQWKTIDYDHPQQLREAILGSDAVVHLTGIAHAKADPSDLLRYEKAICHATEAMIEAALAVKAKSFVYASSVKVYGEKSSAVALSEEAVPHPSSLYGNCKLKGEALVQQRGALIDSTILRFPPMFGPDMKGSVKHIFKAAQLGLPLPFHSFKHRRHFLYVKNASALIISAIRGDLKPGLYNVFDPIAWQMGPFYREVYRAIHGRELPWYLAWRMPVFLEKLLRRLPALAPLLQPFELQSLAFQDWSRFLTHTPQQSIRDVARSVTLRTQNK